MRGRRRETALVLVALTAAGCAAARAPEAYRQQATEIDHTARGGWILLEGGDKHHRILAKGELIAVGTDSVFVIGDSGWVGVAIADVEGGRFEAYHPALGGLVAWTVLGTVSSISHGLGGAVSVPVWIVVGSIATASASGSGLRSVPNDPGESWSEIGKFARFPQGLPPGLDRSSIRFSPIPGQ
jgi:hypothetical protein